MNRGLMMLLVVELLRVAVVDPQRKHRLREDFCVLAMVVVGVRGKEGERVRVFCSGGRGPEGPH